METKNVVKITGSQIALNRVNGNKKRNDVFTFDSCFDSMDSSSDSFASQEMVFDSIGNNILENAFKGLTGISRRDEDNDDHIDFRIQHLYICIWSDWIWKVLHNDGIAVRTRFNLDVAIKYCHIIHCFMMLQESFPDCAVVSLR